MDGEQDHDAATALDPQMSGRWLVGTRNTQHLWDLDTMAHTRLSGPRSSYMEHDGRACHISRVVIWPRVGIRAFVWVEDPSDPLMEHYRVTSPVRSIRRVRDQH